MNIAEWIKHATFRLQEEGISTPRLDAEIICSHVTGMERERLVLAWEQVLTDDMLNRLARTLERRIRREPIAYITGHKEFYSLDMVVDPGVLVPRPETEVLVNAVLDELKHTPASIPRIIDVGTGSGAITAAVAFNAGRQCTFLATDISFCALRVAKLNCSRYKKSSDIFYICTDVLDGIGVGADIIVSNPPYVAESEWNSLMPEICRYEPRSAIVAGSDGMDVIRALIHQAADNVPSGGVLMMEIAPYQCSHVVELAVQTGHYHLQEVLHDLAGRARVVKLKSKQ